MGRDRRPLNPLLTLVSATSLNGYIPIPEAHNPHDLNGGTHANQFGIYIYIY